MSYGLYMQYGAATDEGENYSLRMVVGDKERAARIALREGYMILEKPGHIAASDFDAVIFLPRS